MNSPVQQIKERLTIEEVVSSYIKTERAGQNFRARCPFHNEKTPSFFISPGRGSYYCFGCGAKGDIFSFVEEFEGLDFKGALKMLASKAGVVLENYNPKEESEKEKLYRAMEAAAKFFENNLSKNEEVKKYLESRGLTVSTIKDFRIGFIPEAWRELYSHLKAQGFSDQEIEKAGLAKAAEKGYYDRFRNRVMFPISDSSGRIIAFSGRIFKDDGKSAKYLNSPDTALFNKSNVLYGLDKAKDSIRKNNFSILVEGQMDLILSHQAGYRNTVATSGTALSDATVSKENTVSNLGLVRRLSENIVLAFDADKAGFNASMRAGKIALSLGMDVKVAKMPEGVDPADLIAKDGAPAWKEAIKNSKHLIEFLLNKIIEEKGTDLRKAGRDIKEKVLPYVDALSGSIEKAYFLKKISDASSIPEEALQEDLNKVSDMLKQEREDITEAIEAVKQHRKDHILSRLLGIALWQKSLEKAVIEPERLLENLSQLLGKSVQDILGGTALNGEDLIFEAEVFYGKYEGLEKEVEELLTNLKEEYLKEELGMKMRELHAAEEHKEQEKSSQILKEINEINNKIQAIKNSRTK